jgi:hypothetical protein
VSETDVIAVVGTLGKNRSDLLFETHGRRITVGTVNTLSWSSHSVDSAEH